jgi:hypothetical protein
MDLLLLTLQFDGFSKQSDLNKALTIGSCMWFSSFIGNSIKDEYNSDKEKEEKPIKSYPWFYMFIHLCFIIQIYYAFKKGMDKELRTGLSMGIIVLSLNCFMLHTSHSIYVSDKKRIIQNKKEEEEKRRRYLEQRNK